MTARPTLLNPASTTALHPDPKPTRVCPSAAAVSAAPALDFIRLFRSLAEGLDAELRKATLARADAAERQLEAALTENARIVAELARTRASGVLSRPSLEATVQVAPPSPLAFSPRLSPSHTATQLPSAPSPTPSPSSPARPTSTPPTPCLHHLETCLRGRGRFIRFARTTALLSHRPASRPRSSSPPHPRRP